MLRIEKVVGDLPTNITSSTLYFVRVGLGIEVHLSDSKGEKAYKLNVDTDQVLATKLMNLYVNEAAVTKDDSIIVAISKLNTAVTNLQKPGKVTFTGSVTGTAEIGKGLQSKCVLTLANSGVGAGIYGARNKIPVLDINKHGIITSATTYPLPYGSRSTYKNVTASRKINTVYTNTGDTVKFVSVRWEQQNNGRCNLYVDNIVVGSGGQNGTGGGDTLHAFVIPGSTYMVDGENSITNWVEIEL